MVDVVDAAVLVVVVDGIVVGVGFEDVIDDC